MNNRRIRFGFLRAMLFTIAIVSSLHSPSASAAPALPVVARLHWLGLNQISADPNSATVMKIWHLPETAALERQTLDKLSCWLAGGTNAASARLRPLLDDFVTSEFNLEIRAATNAPPSGSASSSVHRDCQWLLAIHLPTDRMLFWQTNLAVAVADLTGAQALAAPHGWRIRRPQSPEEIEFYRQGDWGVIGMGQEVSQHLPQFTAKPLFALSSNSDSWVEMDVDANQILEISDIFNECLKLPSISQQTGPGLLSLMQPITSGLSRCYLTIFGQDGNVHTHGIFNLVKPWDTELPQWEVPTNYIYRSVNGFMAVRGLAGWLNELPAWRKTGLTPAPNQLFVWSQSGIPFQTYTAFPLPDATNQLAKLGSRLEDAGNLWLTKHGQGKFQWQTNPPLLVWKNAFIVSPWLKPIFEHQQSWILGGLYPLTQADASPPPNDLLQPISTIPNLIYLQTEQLGVRVDSDLFITQLSRVVFHKPQLPLRGVATGWLKQIEPLLGDCATEIVRSTPETLKLKRTSTLGFSAGELHLLADWLESPTFPRGLHSLNAQPNE